MVALASIRKAFLPPLNSKQALSGALGSSRGAFFLPRGGRAWMDRVGDAQGDGRAWMEPVDGANCPGEGRAWMEPGDGANCPGEGRAWMEPGDGANNVGGELWGE